MAVYNKGHNHHRGRSSKTDHHSPRLSNNKIDPPSPQCRLKGVCTATAMAACNKALLVDNKCHSSANNNNNSANLTSNKAVSATNVGAIKIYTIKTLIVMIATKMSLFLIQ